ncbi:hypothetical protein SAMN04488133_1802 [Halobellus limi]|jgi:hypothetical protein|uniref:DUF7315 domain-containing protein n=2 Tax=Halobellus limi TaxID=699433 RepID=A0A1H5Z2P6_9EURY|nr:hypothetical protein SAMN04488133_1802 [Halobellus limi]
MTDRAPAAGGPDDPTADRSGDPTADGSTNLADGPTDPAAEQSAATTSDASEDAAGEQSGETADRERRGRDVVVPMRLYKTVTVFSTLIAVVSVVFGFMLLDAATLSVSFLGNFVRGALAAVGLGVADGILSTVFAVVGLSIIAFGAGVYVIGTRFRARGMGKSQEDSGEGSNNDG